MTNDELMAYFKGRDLPGTLRINRAITQHEVKNAVAQHIGVLLANPNDIRAKHLLEQIINALEKPYDGPEIPGL